MTQPALARKSRSNDGPRIYPWPPAPAPPEFEVISVTSATGELSKPWLAPWAAKLTAEAAISDRAVIDAMLAKDDERGAIDYLKNARFRSMYPKGDRGTIVHSAIEAYVDGTELTPDEIEAKLKAKKVPKKMWSSTHKMIKGVLAFLYDTEPEVLWSEQTVFNRTHGYAGTADLIVRTMVGGKIVPAIIDVKTSKDIYDETAMQLCGYARAEFAGTTDGQELPILDTDEQIRHGIVVRPKPMGGYDTGIFDLNDDVFTLFLGCLTVAKYKGKLADARIG